jgi:hypothetical protein
LAVVAALVQLISAPLPARSMEPGLAEGPGQTGYAVRHDYFLQDVCSIIYHAARRHGIPRDFVARLIRTESRFRASAVSPKGAMGIAQFMPGTARLRGLDDPFDAAAALPVAIDYLAELRVRFGNLGLAAAAYNAGEARVGAWLAEDRGLPLETRTYVRRITGRSADDWKGRADKGEDVAAIGPEPFGEACVKFAAGGAPGSGVGSAVDVAPMPWGAQVAQASSRAGALALFDQVRERHREAIGDKAPMIIRTRNAAFGRARRLAASVGAESRSEAMETCAAIRRAGGYCIVVRAGGS